MPRFAKALLYLVYFVIVAAIVAAVILSFNSSSPKKPSSTPPSSNSQSHNKPAPVSSSGNKSQVLPGGKPSQPTGAPSSLGNTGPGNVIGVFIASSLIGTIASRYVLIKLKEQ